MNNKNFKSTGNKTLIKTYFDYKSVFAAEAHDKNK